jgi:hypothetical protein
VSVAPAPGVECAECMNHGHHAKAVEYVDTLKDAESGAVEVVAMCIFHRDLDPCPGCEANDKERKELQKRSPGPPVPPTTKTVINAEPENGKPPKSTVLATIKMCSRGCGNPTHRGMCKGQQKTLQAKNAPVHHRMEPEVAAQACAAIVSHSVEHSVTQTRKETVTVSEQPHEMTRKVTIIVPKAQPMSQVKLTPEIAQAVWKSLSVQQKYDLMDIEDLWNEYDDDLRMMTIHKILLVHEGMK